ncbi:MAG: DNA alkylation repair protein [Sphingobacteriales bacterium]|nr:MAG: DNA alkylation repair protein [Sphingobacteriales bacterium]
MAEPLKNIYNDLFFAELKTSLQKAFNEFDYKSFLKEVQDKDWPLLELKQRMRRLSTALHNHFKGNYEKRLTQLLKLVDALPAQSKVQYSGLAYMYIPDFLAQYGLDNMNLSLKAMEKINLITSCEFAIRPYLLANEKIVMKQMLAWSKHPHENIRRFASEGCRPRLPWGAAIPSLKKDPSAIIPILENLKNDASVYVQKSVANNLNDISKDNPQLVIDIVKKWQGQSPVTDWILKHACRGLLKSGHKEVLQLFGTSASVQCDIKNFSIRPQQLKIGEPFSFEFKMNLKEKEDAKLRLEYAIYYQKANGTLSKKIFKINEGLYQHGKSYSFSRKHSFKDLTTRKHHAGKHIIAIVVNGNECSSIAFMLKA